MKLYHAPGTRSIRIIWLMEELGLPYELERLGLREPSMRTPEYLQKHPLGRVPTLEDSDVMLFESGAIVQYLLEKYGNGRLQPASDSPEFPKYLQWFHFAEGTIMPPVMTIIVETKFLPPEMRSDTHVERAKTVATGILSAVEQGLEGREYIAGEFSAADIMAGSATTAAVNFGADISDKPNIAAYIERLNARPALIKARAA